MGWYDKVQIQAPRAVDYGDVAKVGIMANQQLNEGLKGLADVVGSDRLLQIQQSEKSQGMLKVLADQEYRNQQAALAQKNYEEGVAARIAQNALQAGTLENQIMQTANTKAHQDALLKLEQSKIAREKQIDADTVKALSFENTKIGEDKEVMVPTGAKILDPTKLGTDANKKYEKLLPTTEEASYMDEAQKLKSMNKEQQDEYFKQKFLASEEAKKAGVDKTGVQKIGESVKPIIDFVDSPLASTAEFLGGNVVAPILNWNKPESEKLLAGKPKAETAPKTFEQYRAEEEDKILKADTKRETLEKKIFEENSSPEMKKEIQKGKKELLSTQELAKSLTGLDPKAQKVILEGQQKLLVSESEKAQKVQEKAQEQVWKERTETLKANLDVEKARLIEAQKNPIKNALEIQEATAKINKLNLEAAKMKKEGSSWFGKDVTDYVEK